MATQIIPFVAGQQPWNEIKRGEYCLDVSEFFFDTIQGEGINVGAPAAFLRLKGCVLRCSYCDTAEVYKHGRWYSNKQLLDMIEVSGLDKKLLKGQHLVFTGGSPLMQQNGIFHFIMDFYKRFGWTPYMEIENECVLPPDPLLVPWIACWNNSPKLTNSDIDFEKRYKPEIISMLASFPNSWFKFVVSSEEDWEEINTGFLIPNYIYPSQIILMPKGETRAELEYTRPIVVQMAIENNVRYCTREHIILWDKKNGI